MSKQTEVVCLRFEYFLLFHCTVNQLAQEEHVKLQADLPPPASVPVVLQCKEGISLPRELENNQDRNSYIEFFSFFLLTYCSCISGPVSLVLKVKRYVSSHSNSKARGVQVHLLLLLLL